MKLEPVNPTAVNVDITIVDILEDSVFKCLVKLLWDDLTEDLSDQPAYQLTCRVDGQLEEDTSCND